MHSETTAHSSREWKYPHQVDGLCVGAVARDALLAVRTDVLERAVADLVPYVDISCALLPTCIKCTLSAALVVGRTPENK